MYSPCFFELTAGDKLKKGARWEVESARRLEHAQTSQSSATTSAPPRKRDYLWRIPRAEALLENTSSSGIATPSWNRFRAVPERISTFTSFDEYLRWGGEA